MRAVIPCAASAVGASTITRTSCSVPEGRKSTWPLTGEFGLSGGDGVADRLRFARRRVCRQRGR